MLYLIYTYVNIWDRYVPPKVSRVNVLLFRASKATLAQTSKISTAHVSHCREVIKYNNL